MAQEQRKYEKEYKVQAVKLAKEIGAVPDNLEVSFPPLWTPTAKEIAGIARDKAEIIMAAFQANLFDQSTALKELKKLEGETGMFSSISEKDIAAGRGRTIQDLTALRDPLAGISFGEEEPSPFEGAAQDAAVTADYSPDQPRDKNGRWTNGGSESSAETENSSEKELTSGEESDKIKSFQETVEPSIAQKIASGEYSTKLSEQQLAKHTPGTKQFEQYQASRLKNGDQPQSIVTVNADEAQQLILRYAGKGERRVSLSGEPMHIEFVTTDQIVGKYFVNDQYVDTKRMAIHYGKKSSHIVPVKEEKKRG